ncbi:hypothetical protein Cgig2_009106 [Carnegiea gigantea]|uniref:SWIM-type domain-containing protein n=1 Tax=Carnegiea gigantea TaxID=171969 RepID=A0A9Q1K2Y8_9CARY|nr:hypothetical protein Cgig2_009106 [Carnegiea gigantea]
MSDDDEISIASEDADDEETTKNDDAGDEQAAEKRCHDGNKRKGSADGNDVNDNLSKKMDKHKTEILKWKNRVGEKIEQKLADTYKKIGCVTAVGCYSLMLGEYSIELTNNRRLVVKMGQRTCTYRQWLMRGLPCCHALAVIAKANLCVYDYIHPNYKTATQEVIYNQLVHPMETHEMGIVDRKIGLVVGGEELDEDYNPCI